MFLYQGWYLHREKDNSFLTLCIANFGLTATYLPVVFTKEVFSFLDRLVLFLSSLNLFFF